jgi:hypothetical protein
VVHDRGLDKSFVIVDDESPGGWRCGLRMVLGIVLPESTPARLRGIGNRRNVVKRQRGRGRKAKIEQLIDDSPNLERIADRRANAVVRAPELVRPVPGGGKGSHFVAPAEAEVTGAEVTELRACARAKICVRPDRDGQAG